MPMTPTPTRKLKNVAIICFWMSVINSTAPDYASALSNLYAGGDYL